MPYTILGNWKNRSEDPTLTGQDISKAALDHIEQGIYDASVATEPSTLDSDGELQIGGAGVLDANGDLQVGGGVSGVLKEHVEFKTDDTAQFLFDGSTAITGLRKRGTGTLSLKVNNNQLLTANSDLSSATWTKTSASVIADATTDYDGGSAADLVTGSANVASLVSQDFAFYQGSGKTLVFGVYLKAATTHTARLTANIYDNSWASLQGFQKDVVVDNTWRYFSLVSAFSTFGSAVKMNVAVRPDVSGSTNLPIYIYKAELREQITVTSFPTIAFVDGDEGLLSATGVTDSLRATLSLLIS